MRTSVDVHNFLVERDSPHELVSMRGRLRSAERIAAILDLPPHEVGKVVIYDGGDAPVAAVVASGSEPDGTRVRAASGQPHAERATDERASELTDYLSESIPPAGLPEGFVIVLDRSLNRDTVLYFPGGEARSILKIRGKDLAKATGAKVASIAARTGRGPVTT